MGGFRLHGDKQYLSHHGDIGLRRVSGRIGVIVGLVPVAALYGSHTACGSAGGGAAVVGEGAGEGSSPLHDTVGVSITIGFLSCNRSTLRINNLRNSYL